MAQLATAEGEEVIRSLGEYERLIREQLELGQKAGISYYRAAGELMSDAREDHFKNNTAGFFEWTEKKFGVRRTQTRTWMALAPARIRKPLITPKKDYESLRDFKRRGLGQPSQINRPSGPVRDWSAPVSDVAQRAHAEAFRLAREESLSRAQEREAERKLALRLIDIGFKVLAKELHPDKLGGDRDAMARLNRVRDRLKECI